MQDNKLIKIVLRKVQDLHLPIWNVFSDVNLCCQSNMDYMDSHVKKEISVC